MRIILLSGKSGSGKDTAAEIMKDYLKADGYSAQIIHFADLLKFISKTYFDWDGEKDENGRNLLQYIGNDVVRNKDENFWTNFVVKILGFFPDVWDFVIIPDCRYENEISELSNKGYDVTNIRIFRINFQNQLTPEQQTHISETALDKDNPDYYIINSGTINDLKNNISIWISGYLGFHQISLDEFLEA